MKLYWDDAIGRFRGTGGQLVSTAKVREVVDDIAEQASERMAVLASRLSRGEISLATFQSDMMREIKLSQSAAAVIAHGGADQMTSRRWGYIGSQVKKQYKFAQGFAEDIASGKQAFTERGLVARARQYGQASRTTFNQVLVRDQVARGYSYARNILHAGESCSECKGQSSKGWMPIEDLVPIGSRTCRAQCRCTVEFRYELAA